MDGMIGESPLAGGSSVHTKTGSSVHPKRGSSVHAKGSSSWTSSISFHPVHRLH